MLNLPIIMQVVCLFQEQGEFIEKGCPPISWQACPYDMPEGN